MQPISPHKPSNRNLVCLGTQTRHIIKVCTIQQCKFNANTKMHLHLFSCSLPRAHTWASTWMRTSKAWKNKPCASLFSTTEIHFVLSTGAPLEELQNRLMDVQCLLYQSVPWAEEGSRQFSEGEYSSHTIVILCPRSNTEVFGAPLWLRSSGCNISNTSPRKCCARANNYKSLQALLHFRFFIYASIKSFPFLCHLQL